MTMNKKRFLGILLSLALVLGLMTGMCLTALAGELTNSGNGHNDRIAYSLWVGGVQVNSENAMDTNNHPTWSYSSQTNTLTLDGYSYTGNVNNDPGTYQLLGLIYTTIGLNIELKGTNSVKNTATGSSCGIYVGEYLTITGSGTLTAEGGDYGILCQK